MIPRILSVLLVPILLRFLVIRSGIASEIISVRAVLYEFYCYVYVLGIETVMKGCGKCTPVLSLRESEFCEQISVLFVNYHTITAPYLHFFTYHCNV